MKKTLAIVLILVLGLQSCDSKLKGQNISKGNAISDLSIYNLPSKWTNQDGKDIEMKIARHAQIIKLINQYDIETQEELAKKLEESGFAVTQATISRDIRQLKLTKVPKENGGSRYAVLQNAPSEVGSRYARVLKDAYISVDLAKNILVIKTVSGMAMAAAAAFDEMNWNEIVGCIGGDDTILCVARDDDAALVAAERLKKMVDGMEETGEEF